MTWLVDYGGGGMMVVGIYADGGTRLTVAEYGYTECVMVQVAIVSIQFYMHLGLAVARAL